MTPETRSKLQLTALLLITALPITAATIYFTFATSSGNLGGAVNNGTLINPPLDITALDMRNADGELIYRTFEEEVEGVDARDYEPRPWLMVFAASESCGVECRERVTALRQLHITLGKDMQRVRRYYLNTVPGPLDTDTSEFFRAEFPSMGIAHGDYQTIQANLQDAGLSNTLNGENRLFLVDPVGNVMMYYVDRHSLAEIKEDLEKLLELSTIG